MPAAAEWSLTPRAGIYLDNTSQRQSNVNLNTPEVQNLLEQLGAAAAGFGSTFVADTIDTATNSTQVAIPQFGATLTFGWRGSDTTQIALTALYGTTSAKNDTTISQQFLNFTTAGTRITDTIVSTTRYDSDVERLDIELTLQHRLNETFSLIGGLRAERTVTDRYNETVASASANYFNYINYTLGLPFVLNGVAPPVGPIFYITPPSTLSHDKIELWTYSVRAGAAAYAPVGDKHLFYVNGLVQLSSTPSGKVTTTYPGGGRQGGEIDSETSVGPDISVGYMYRMSDRFGFDVRYRATVYFPISGQYEFKDARVNHGVGIGFTTWFGDE